MNFSGVLGVILALSAAAAHAQPMPATFNLICTGNEIFMEQGDGLFPKMQPAKPFTTTYRIDLKAKRLCVDDCNSTVPIVDVTDTTITFEKSAFEEGGVDYVSRVNRESGKYQSVRRFGLGKGLTWGKGAVSTVRDGMCEAAPFSGFPRPKF